MNKLSRIFKKLTKKVVLAILAIIVIGAPLLYLTVLNQKEASAWFDENWNYRAAVPISAHTSAENNVYITVTLDTATPIAASKMQTDCGDLRFTKENGELLPYFINASPGCNNAATTIQVNFDSFPAGAQTIYYYYGNASAPNGFNNAGFSTAATGATIGSVGSEAQGPGPVGYWKFNEGTGTTAQDSSSNNLDGTITTATWQTEDQCISGKCLKLDGTDDYVQTSSTTDLTTFTASAWIRPTALSGTNAIISHGGSPTDNGWSFETAAANNTLRLTFHGVANYDSNTNIVSTNTWQFVAVTLSGTTATFYHNGRQVGTVTTGSMGTASHVYSIGAYPAGTNDFSGFIDEPKVYNYTRSAAQIKTDYLAGKANAGTKQGTSAVMGAKPQDWLSNGLVGYWKMDESSGNASDSSGNGTTLTNNNTTAYAAGKFGNGGSFTAASLHYFSTATTISGVKTVAFWVNPSASTDEYVNLTSSAYITSSSGTITATGFTSPSIYVNGVLNGTVTASAWNHVVITTDTAINANQFEVGRANGSYVNGTIDETRVYNRAFSPKEVSDLYNFAPGPVGYWNFEEGTGTTVNDTSGNANTGTWNGTGSHWTNGKYGKGGNFNSVNNDYIIGSGTIMNGSSGTFSVWMKSSDNTSDIYNTHSGAWNQNSLYGNGIGMFLRISNGDSGMPDVSFNFSSNNVFDNNWHMITTTWTSGGERAIWVDGKKVASANGTVTFTAGSNFELAEKSWEAQYFSGSMDGMRIYNYARTQKQIVSDMNAGHPAVGSPVGSAVAYWKLDEGYSTTANDSTPNANSLTLSSASWTNAGKFGKSWNGTGALWLSRADDSDFDVTATDDYAVSLWFKSDSATNPSAAEYLFNKANATTAGYAVYANTDGTICFGIDDDTSWGPDVSSCTSSDVYDNTWHHLVAVRDTVADKTLIYVDGVLKDSDTDTTTATLANSLSLYVGDRDGVDNGDEFNGDLDEIKVYRYALTQDEIRTDYNRGSSLIMGAAGNNSTYAAGAANQEYCVPGDSTSCAAPVGEWHLNEKVGQTFNDTSGNGFSGNLGTDSTSEATDPTWTNGKYGGGLNFDKQASTRTTIAHNDTLNPSAITIEAWIKPLPCASGVGNIVAKNSNSGYRFRFSGCSEAAGIGWFDRGATNNLGSISTIPLNVWSHITVTGSSSGLKIYINGKLDNSNSTAYGAGATTGSLFFGGDPGGVGEHFNGIIDEVKIFNYERSPAQIAWDYNRGKPVGWWKMDECQGGTANDSSGNSNTGTITIGASGENTIGTCTTSSTAWGSGATGKRNASLSFDGTDDYVNIPDPSSGALDFPGTGGWTAAAWIKTSSTNLQMVVAKDSNAAGGRGYNLYTDGGVVKGDFFQSDGAVTSVASTTPSITDNAWHHIGWTYTYVTSGTSIVNIYVDGKLVKTASNVVGPIQNSVSALNIGARVYVGATSNFTGQIDDARVFNYALTAAQVKDVMNNGAVNFGPVTGSP